MRYVLFPLVALVLMASAATAQSTRYSTWSDPNNPGANANNAQMQEFLERLNKLVDEAEKARAADPIFLRDLRDLANGYTRPWNKVVLSDNFGDGDFTQNPVWQVMAGEYFIETGWGLRNRLITKVQSSNETQSGNSGDDLAKAILGTILKRATGTPTAQETAPGENAIITRVSVSNAFAIDFEMSSWVADNHFEIGVFQGDAAQIGYRLLYVSGKGMQLQRVGNRGSSVIATSSQPIAIEDKAFHRIEWTRAKDGTMRVSLDGAEIMTAVDRGFSDPFDGVRISDRGGDHIIKQITVQGL